MSTGIKAKYWMVVCYPENMVDDWKDHMDDLLEYPYEYCVHDKDSLGKFKQKKSDLADHDIRKEHVHIILAFSNTTTYNNAFHLFERLNAPGKKAFNKIEKVQNIRRAHEYLIHNTKTAIKQGKYQYDPAERICGNNFDVGAYEQVSIADKQQMLKTASYFIRDNGIYNFMDAFDLILDAYGEDYFEVFKAYSGLLDRLCKANYHKRQDRIYNYDRMQRTETESETVDETGSEAGDCGEENNG